MRPIPFICLATLFISCAGTKNTSTNPGPMNGTWIPVKEDIGGSVLPRIIYEKQKLTVSDSNYTFIAESVDKGIVRYNGDKLDIYGKEGVNKGKHFTAIYKNENGQLTICYNLAGTGYPESYETRGKPTYFLCLFRKE
jgi:uncharacterized protein (TIGR03067 family)